MIQNKIKTHNMTHRHNYGTCATDAGWMLVDTDTGCTDWEPDEGSSIPGIRFTTSTDSNGLNVYGGITDSTTNFYADSMVFWVNVDNSSSFGLTDDPTPFPSQPPTLSQCDVNYGYCRGSGDPHILTFEYVLYMYISILYSIFCVSFFGSHSDAKLGL